MPEKKNPGGSHKGDSQFSIMNWRSPIAGKTAATAEQVPAINPREHILKDIRKNYRAAQDVYRERLSDLRAAGAISIPEYPERKDPAAKSLCAAVPLQLYLNSKDPGAIEYVPLIVDPSKHKDQFYFSVVERKPDTYTFTSTDQEVLREGIKGNVNRAASRAVLEAQKLQLITEHHAVLASVRLDRKLATDQSIYLEYVLHPNLEAAHFGAAFIEHLFELYYTDFGFKAMAIQRDYLPEDLDPLVKKLPSTIRLLDLATFDRQRYPDQASIMQRFGVTRIDALLYRAGDSLNE